MCGDVAINASLVSTLVVWVDDHLLDAALPERCAIKRLPDEVVCRCADAGGCACVGVGLCAIKKNGVVWCAIITAEKIFGVCRE